MSLLLDALRKAELAKQRQQQGQAPEPSTSPGEYPGLSLQQDEAPVEPPAAPALEVLSEAAPIDRQPAPAELMLEPVAPVVEQIDTADSGIAAPEAVASTVPEPESDLVSKVVTRAGEAAAAPQEPIAVEPAVVAAAVAAPSRSGGALAARFGAAGQPDSPPRPPETEPAAATGAEPIMAAAKSGPAAVTDFTPTSKASPEAAWRVMASKPPRKPVNRTLLLAIGGVLLVAGMAGYLWWQMQPPTIPATPLAAQPDAAAAPAVAATTEPVVGPVAPPGAPAAAAAHGHTDSGVAAARQPSAIDGKLQRGAPAAVHSVAAGSPTITDKRLQIVRDAPQESLDEGVQAGYRAFANGDLANARLAYGRTLQADPRNRDALLGMAAVAARQGKADDAERWYRKQLEIDPLDQAAQAGLTAVARGLGPRERESALRNLGEQQAASPQTAAQLGNLYAAEKRWNDAQQQFFRAYSLEPTNPDHAFNLAVSLEHLDQPKLALDYYNKAQQLGSQHKPGFDPAELKARIEALSQP